MIPFTLQRFEYCDIVDMMDDISTVFLYLFLSPYQTHTLFFVDPMAMEELV